MPHAPWTLRSADWPVTSKTILALIGKDIGKSSSYFENSASTRDEIYGPRIMIRSNACRQRWPRDGSFRD